MEVSELMSEITHCSVLLTAEACVFWLVALDFFSFIYSPGNQFWMIAKYWKHLSLWQKCAQGGKRVHSTHRFVFKQYPRNEVFQESMEKGCYSVLTRYWKSSCVCVWSCVLLFGDVTEPRGFLMTSAPAPPCPPWTQMHRSSFSIPPTLCNHCEGLECHKTTCSKKHVS